MEERSIKILGAIHRSRLKKKGAGFLIPFLTLTGVWYFIYEIFIVPSQFYNQAVIEKIAILSENLLSFLGYDTFTQKYNNEVFVDHVGVVGSDGVLIGTGCDGLIVIALFVFFIVSFSGKIVHKLWYIPLGVFLVYLLNVIRVATLAVLMNSYPEWLEFNHDYTFTVLMYAFVFLLWYVWVKKYSGFGK